MTLALAEAEKNIRSAMDDESEKKDSSDAFIDPLEGMLAPPMEEIHSDPSIHLLTETSLEPINSIEEPEASTEEVQNIIENALPLEQEAPPATTTTEAHPTHIFQIKISGLDKPEFAARFDSLLKRLPPHPAFSIEEGRWQSRGAFRATRMNETSAYMLAREAYRSGLNFQLSITDFARASDDELSELGSGLNSEPETAKSSGAQAVEIPSSADEILLSTTPTVAGYRAAKPKGIVTAHGSIPKILYREEEKNPRLHSQIEIMGRKPSDSPLPRKLPRAEIDKVMAQLLDRLQQEAYRRGANGVLSVQIQAFPESNSLEPGADQIRIIASGTAVLLVAEGSSTSTSG
jgi:uncharacterized protein YbjQ (UPF0145 family)